MQNTTRFKLLQVLALTFSVAKEIKQGVITFREMNESQLF